ncbi:hypothetical protein BDL97_01G139500 [Sphagnum fallax]|nr:hypothetical protein BDL97_01G139500 [Sphagnum fallax]
MLVTRQQTAFADENRRGEHHGGKPAPPSKAATAGTGRQHHNSSSSHNVARAVQASNRRALGDIGNLVGAMSVRCNVSKDSVQERYGAAPLNSQNATKPLAPMAVKVEVQAEVKLEGVASWGAKQRRTVASAKPRDIAVSSAAVPLHDAHSTTSGQARSSAAHKPGQAAGPSRLKAHARLAAVKKEDQTLTALLTARSAAACGGIDAEMQEAEMPVSNIDQHDIGNQLAVVDYVEDIYTFYHKIEVHLKFKLMMETLYLTTNLIDRYLSVRSVSRKNLQLVGVTALLLAAKYEEIWAPEVHDFIFISDNAYTREQILNMEKSMLNTLQFNLTVPTPYVFVARCLKAAAADKEEKAVATELEMVSWYLVELCLTEYSMVKFCPSHLAAAAVYTAQNTLARKPCWGPALQQHSGYTEAQLMECATMMVAFQSKAGTGSLTVVHKKYSNTRFLSVAKLTPPTFSNTVKTVSPSSSSISSS